MANSAKPTTGGVGIGNTARRRKMGTAAASTATPSNAISTSAWAPVSVLSGSRTTHLIIDTA